MCGIAGLIYKGKSSNVGGEMTAMLQALKHRGPDSTGYAIYGKGNPGEYGHAVCVGRTRGYGKKALACTRSWPTGWLRLKNG